MKFAGKSVLIFLVFLHVVFLSLAQQSFVKSTSFGLQYHYGSFITMAPKAQYLRDSYTGFGELYFERTNYNWSTVKQPVRWGVSLFFGNTGSRKYMGNMAGALPFISMPLIKRSFYNSKFRVGAGLGWVEKPYDKNSNHKNVLIGSPVNACINFLWQNEFKINHRLLFNAGFSFTHLSNGASKLPNLGINVPAVSIGIKYSGKEQAISRHDFPDSFNRKLSFSAFTSVGFKQQPWIGSKQYLVNTLAIEATKKLSYNNQYGAGIIMFYDRSMQVNPYSITSDKREGKNVQLGVYASYEHSFGRFSLPLQLSGYVYNHDIYSVIFQQVGVRYHLPGHWTIQALLKTHGGKADVIHGGIGYKLK